MSTTSSPTGECRHCGGDRCIQTSTTAFCSSECQARYRAEKALNQLRQDSRFCGSCGAQLRTIEEPTDEFDGTEEELILKHAYNAGALSHTVNGQQVLDLTACDDEPRTQGESICGYRYRTEDAETVLKERPGGGVVSPSVGCRCGTTAHHDTIDELRQAHPARTLANYVRAFRILEREGAIQRSIHKQPFFESYRETRDFDLALGRSLE